MSLIGGPYHGHDHSFRTPSSLIFTARGFTGYYQYYQWLEVTPVPAELVEKAKALGYPVVIEKKVKTFTSIDGTQTTT